MGRTEIAGSFRWSVKECFAGGFCPVGGILN